jgi:uncharacterized protein YgbK (DUF1537 family)
MKQNGTNPFRNGRYRTIRSPHVLPHRAVRPGAGPNPAGCQRDDHGLQAEGTTVERYQMTSHPHKFMNNNDVMRLVREQQMAALPITAVHGQVIKTGAYPTLEELRAAVNGSVTQ